MLDLVGDLSKSTIAVLGLTYKPGTDTLRRSGAVEFCRWAGERGAAVASFDPAVSHLPPDLSFVRLENSAPGALRGADAVLIATTWPVFRDLGAEVFVANMRGPIVLDPERFLEPNLTQDKRIVYVAIGMSNEAG